MLSYLIDAAQLMEDIYWKEAYGDKNVLLSSLDDQATKDFVKINYGPWERLKGNEPFIDSLVKPAGAQFYPIDMTKEEFEAFESEDKTSLYTVIRRDETGKLVSIPYHIAFKEETDKAIELIKKAAELAEDEGFKKYLELRAEALATDDYFESDLAWMSMKTNKIDFCPEREVRY